MTVGASIPVQALMSVTSNAICIRGARTTCERVPYCNKNLSHKKRIC